MTVTAIGILGYVFMQQDTGSFLKGAFSPKTQHITVNGVPVSVEIAATPQERAQGLSGRTTLGPGQGMLFIFQEDGAWRFWMKDMHFPIDIIWIDNNGFVVAAHTNVSPSTYPQTFEPSRVARYVLEVPAGFMAQHHISIGDAVVTADFITKLSK